MAHQLVPYRSDTFIPAHRKPIAGFHRLLSIIVLVFDAILYLAPKFTVSATLLPFGDSYQSRVAGQVKIYLSIMCV